VPFCAKAKTNELLPGSATIGVLANPTNPNLETDAREVEEAARALGRRVVTLHVTTDADIDAAFAGLAAQRMAGLIVVADPFLLGRREQIVLLAARHAVPGIYPVRDFPLVGGLMSYGTSLADGYRIVAAGSCGARSLATFRFSSRPRSSW
jgi:ABC-type uncharacterized transport system substrate-binding protein